MPAEGGGFTWSHNSRDYQLTPWTNDMVINRPGEALYVTDLDSNAVMTPYAGLSRNPKVQYETRHGLGYSVFSSEENGIGLELTQTVDRERPVKVFRLRVSNKGKGTRRLRLYNYAEWVLGINPHKTKPFILSSLDEETGALFANNPYSIDYSKRVAFMAASEAHSSFG